MLIGPFTVQPREIILKKWTKNMHTAETWYTPKKIWKYVLLWKRNTIVNISIGLGESNKDSHKRYSHTEKKERKTSGNINSKNVQR